MAVHALHVAGERHDHGKELDQAMEQINAAGGQVTHVEHVAIDGPYDRMMVSTVVIYLTAD